MPNRGQVHRSSVRYYAETDGFATYFSSDRVTTALTKGGRGAALELRFVGARPGAQPVPEERARGRTSYISGSGRYANLPNYGALTYRALWPGIDMSFRARAGKLQYEFRVHPGADPSHIRLMYAGDRGLALTTAGALRIGTAAGALVDARPRTYQEIGGKRVPVASGFALHGSHTYGFRLARHDGRRPLVIDPDFGYSTFLGGRFTDEAFGVAVDHEGNAYVTGRTFSPDFPTTPGAFQPATSDEAVFVTKLSQDGSSLVYSTVLDGSNPEEPRAIAVDDQGDAYVTGATLSSDFPTTPGSYDTSYNGSYDTFLTKLSPDGSNLVYSTYLGGSSFEGATVIALDHDGAAYLTGNTASTDFPTTPGAYQTTNNGGNDVFVTKFDPSGSSLAYSTLLGSRDQSEFAYGLGVDGEGHAYVTGLGGYAGTFPTTDGAFDRTANGNGDAFVSKIAVDGSSLLSSTYLGGGQYDVGVALGVDGDGNPYVLGITYSGDFPTTPNAYDTTANGGSNIFVTKLHPDLSRLGYSTYLGGGSAGGTFGGHGIEVDAYGHATVSGTTGSPDFPTTTPSTGPFNPGPIATRLDPSGSSLVYSTQFGGSEYETSGGIATDARGDIYLAGMTDSSDFPVTPGAYDTTFNGGSDTYVTKLRVARSSTPGCTASAGGRITSQNGDTATFSGRAQASSEESARGNLGHVDHGPATPFRMRSLTIDALVCDGAGGASLFGVGDVDGAPLDFEIDLFDSGQPGRKDTYRLRLSNGYDTGVRHLKGGNVQVRSS